MNLPNTAICHYQNQPLRSDPTLQYLLHNLPTHQSREKHKIAMHERPPKKEPSPVPDPTDNPSRPLRSNVLKIFA